MQMSGEECSGSEAGEFLTCVRINREARVVGVKWAKRRGRLIDEVREVRSQVGLGFVNHHKDLFDSE